jgi:hypothetical protein
MKKKPRKSRLGSFSNNALVVVVVGSFFGTVLTNIYAFRLKDMEYERADKLARLESLTVELNKIRMHKIGEVWEQIDENEVGLDKLLDSVNRTPSPDKVRFAQTTTVITKDIIIINKNRFWLGEEMYDQLLKYMAINAELVELSFLGRPGIDLSKPRKRRSEAKHNIIKLRNVLVSTERESGNSPSPTPQ